jgi:hypothetical protein|tara:strand:- start:318 stop:572 length:255 start_codon:yes stop_codon:yes gene_type:complete
MSLKEKVEAMKIVTRQRGSGHGYNSQQVYGTLYAYIAELEAKLAAADKPAPAKKAPAKKAPTKKAPTKKPAAKKAPAKKAPKKK